jgi:Ca2+-transporting ATPase
LSRLRGATAGIVVLATLASALVLVQIPELAQLLHLRPLHLDDWAIAIGAGVLVALITILAPASD